LLWHCGFTALNFAGSTAAATLFLSNGLFALFAAISRVSQSRK
jgi:hypothetical protein